MADPSKSDWKHFKAVREVALQRLCQRILGEVRVITADKSKTAYERYKLAFKAISDGDENVARCFDNLSRSQMFMQLVFMNIEGILEDSEIKKFSYGIQKQLKSYMEI